MADFHGAAEDFQKSQELLKQKQNAFETLAFEKGKKYGANFLARGQIEVLVRKLEKGVRGYGPQYGIILFRGTSPTRGKCTGYTGKPRVYQIIYEFDQVQLGFKEVIMPSLLDSGIKVITDVLWTHRVLEDAGPNHPDLELCHGTQALVITSQEVSRAESMRLKSILSPISPLGRFLGRFIR